MNYNADVLALTESIDNGTSVIHTETRVDGNLTDTSSIVTSDRTERLFDSDEIERSSDSV